MLIIVVNLLGLLLGGKVKMGRKSENSYFKRFAYICLTLWHSLPIQIQYVYSFSRLKLNVYTAMNMKFFSIFGELQWLAYFNNMRGKET